MNQGQIQELKKTPLYDLHRELGARMVPFAGYSMPVQYTTGIKKEHEHTRTSAGLFDISHMGQLRVAGNNAPIDLEKLVPGDIQGLPVNRQRYSVLTNRDGGILDDLMITCLSDSYFIVVNAARKTFDINYLSENLADNMVEMLEGRALIALQGPKAVEVLSRRVPGITGLRFLEAGWFDLAGEACLVHRCGYTGEDGFEISIQSEAAETLARDLLGDPAVLPVGLGARDTLRLEAGLCLYGHDLDETTTPVEADLAWVIAAKYRENGFVDARFPGADIISAQLKDGPDRVRKGFRPNSPIPVREGTVILDGDGKKAGIITSGGFGQTVGGPVAMGYVTRASLERATFLVEIRNRTIKLSLVDLPFVKHRYFKTR